MSNHHRSPYIVGKFLQNNNLKFLENSSGKSIYFVQKVMDYFWINPFSKRYNGF